MHTYICKTDLYSYATHHMLDIDKTAQSVRIKYLYKKTHCFIIHLFYREENPVFFVKIMWSLTNNFMTLCEHNVDFMNTEGKC